MGHRDVPFQDFRQFLDALRAKGELIDVDRPVALELEVANAMRRAPRLRARRSFSRTTAPTSRWSVVCTTRGPRR
jgi:UbiD family decarboxylase